MTQTNSSSSPNTLNYFVVAVTFLVVGLAIGLGASNVLVTKQDVESIVRAEVANVSVSVDESVIQEAVKAAVAALPTPATATTTTASGGLDEATVQRIVTDALAQANRQDSKRFELVDNDPFLGDVDAAVVIVEFSAYACPFCKRHYDQTFVPLLENYGQYIRYVYRDFPTINPDVSFPAALAANCAEEQGKFWEYHELLFANQSRLGRDYFFLAAEQLELDMAEFTVCFEEQRYLDEVNADYFDGSLNSISGTPSFFINGTSISGAQPYEIFERIVLRELDKAGIKP